jgi:Trypsin
MFKGDSGGGLVMQVGVRWTLIGVLSRGDERGCILGPDRYINVAYFLDCIRNTFRGSAAACMVNN